jgi:acyl carrier protein
MEVMNINEIKNIIYPVVSDYFTENGIEDKVTDETVLFGLDSAIDSLGFVNIIVDIENQLKEQKFDITIASDRAMSRKNSPFKSINTLAEFIKDEIAEYNK